MGGTGIHVLKISDETRRKILVERSFIPTGKGGDNASLAWKIGQPPLSLRSEG